MARCHHMKASGEPCRAAALTDDAYCFWHSPAHGEEAQEARRLGGLRRRKERTVVGAYGLQSLASVEDIRRLLEIAVVDTLNLENSISRSRTLAYLAQISLRALETGDLEERLLRLEGATRLG